MGQLLVERFGETISLELARGLRHCAPGLWWYACFCIGLLYLTVYFVRLRFSTCGGYLQMRRALYLVEDIAGFQLVNVLRVILCSTLGS